jgi:hypothetical protein
MIRLVLNRLSGIENSLKKSILIFMDVLVISQARKFGFTCQLNDEGLWEISASSPQQRWKISQFEERWLLSISNIPQMYLTSSEVELFLKRRYSFLKKI